MPFQGNDNRSTAAWLPKAAVAPSAKWNSTYTVHYKHPAKRYSKNHEYWLRKAAARMAAQNAADSAELAYLQQTRGSQAFRESSLIASYNAALRHPSSLARRQLADANGLIVARPLDAGLRDTSFRHFDSFGASTTQRYYARPTDVSALRVLEGAAAGDDAAIPLQATARPATRAPVPFVVRQRPQTAGPTRAHHDAGLVYPSTSVDDATAIPYANYVQPTSFAAPRSTAWAETGYAEPTTFDESSQSFVPQQAQLGAYTLRAPGTRLASPAADARTRSQTFRPQLSASRSTPTIPANTLLDVAQSPSRYQSRASEWQGHNTKRATPTYTYGQYEQVLEV